MPPAYIRYLFSRNLEGKELTDEKIRDFKRIVLAQTILILELLLFYFFEFLGFPYYLEIAETIFLSTVGVYCFFFGIL